MYFKHIKSNLLALLLIVGLAALNQIAQAQPLVNIEDYRPVFMPVLDKQQHLQIAIRAFNSNKVASFVIVNPETLKTAAVTADELLFTGNTLHSMTQLKQTPYLRALARYSAPPYRLHNYGVTHAEHSVDGMFLTIDLAPALKVLPTSFEQDFFSQLITLSPPGNKALPLGIAVSGLWLLKHKEQFEWLVERMAENKFDITWVNHSYSHPFYRDVKARDNYLLAPRINLLHEVLDTEKLLLSHQQVPSIWFRFPGLVSDESAIRQISQLGLIPLGGEIDLARGKQPTKNGSILLVDGSGDEHDSSIALAAELTAKKTINWLPLNELIVSSNAAQQTNR
ncbi:MAG: palindromic element RPE3 domain-containing protein [Gammaproteobacteria bacterium]